MALGFVAAVRDARNDAITTQIGNAGLLRIYDGSRPATGGSATTLLAELTMGTPFAAGSSSGVLTASAISTDTSANATGTATWFRLATSGGTAKIDGNVATSASDLNVNTTSIVSGVAVAVTSLVLTDGNP
jgi:hypothetical protein